MSDDAEFEQFVKNMKKRGEEYKKTDKYKKFANDYKNVKPIIQQFVDEEIKYTELKKYCVKNKISSNVFIRAYLDILNNYEYGYHLELDYEDLNDKEKKLWRESFNNYKIIIPIEKKLEKLADTLESDNEEEEEPKKEVKKVEPKKEVNKEVKKEVKKEPKKVESQKEVKKEVKKETKKPIIVKLQKLCNELNEESDEE